MSAAMTAAKTQARHDHFLAEQRFQAHHRRLEAERARIAALPRYWGKTNIPAVQRK